MNSSLSKIIMETCIVVFFSVAAFLTQLFCFTKIWALTMVALMGAPPITMLMAFGISVCMSYWANIQSIGLRIRMENIVKTLKSGRTMTEIDGEDTFSKVVNIEVSCIIFSFLTWGLVALIMAILL